MNNLLKSVFLSIILLFILFIPVNAQKLQYKCGETDNISYQIKPYINIINDSTSTVNLSELKLRYYYTKEGTADEEFHIEYSSIGSSKITYNFYNEYVEIGFVPTAGILEPEAELGELRLRINKTDWSDYDQTNDWSFSINFNYLDYYAIPLYRNDILIWGLQPDSPPTPTPTPSPTSLGYTLHVETEGITDPVTVSYHNYPDGKSVTPVDIYQPYPMAFTVYPQDFDIPNETDYTDGYYFWSWDDHIYYGYANLRTPIPYYYLRLYTWEDTLTLKYASYSEPAVFQTPRATPERTPPPPLYVNINIVDANTGLLIDNPDLHVLQRDYFTFEDEGTWNTGVISYIIDSTDFSSLEYTDYLFINCPGYHELIIQTPYSQTEEELNIIELYPLTEVTPVPESFPYITHTPTPSPPPKINGTWYYLVNSIPPEVSFSHTGTSAADVHLHFTSPSIRVIDWGNPEVSGNDIIINMQLIEWDGPAPFYATHFHHSYNLGLLQEGSEYNLIIEQWDTIIETYPFIVNQDSAPLEITELNIMTEPDLTLDVDRTGSITRIVPRLLLFENYYVGEYHNIAWGNSELNGNIISVNMSIVDVPVQGEGIHYYSKAFDFEGLSPGDYQFKALINNTLPISNDFYVPSDSESPPPVPLLEVKPQIDFPYVKLTIDNESVYYPDNSFTITLKNYGTPCVIESPDFFTSEYLTIVPGTINLGTGESIILDVYVDWSELKNAETVTSYNAFVVTSQGYRNYIPWEVILKEYVSISGNISYFEPTDGVSIILSGDSTGITYPDSTGYYEFTNLTPGNYSVSVLYTPPAPRITIIQPESDDSVFNTFDIQAEVITAVCDYIFEPVTYSLENISQDTDNCDFAMTDATDCCLMCTNVEYYINEQLIYSDQTDSMCYTLYTYEVDSTLFTEGPHQIKVVAEDDSSNTGYDQIDFNIIPEPTPMPESGGDVWFVPQDIEVNVRDYFETEIHIDSGYQKIASYGFDIHYDPEVIELNLQIGNNGVEVGPDGFIAAVGPTDVGQGIGFVRISGFDPTGYGPGSDLNFMKINWIALNIGITILDLEINRITDEMPDDLAFPNAIDGSVSVPCCMLGDVNEDRTINIVDALLITHYYIGFNFTLNSAFADVDQDFDIDIVDALIVAQVYVGIIPSLPVGSPVPLPDVTFPPEAGTVRIEAPTQSLLKIYAPDDPEDLRKETPYKSELFVDVGNQNLAAYGIDVIYNSSILYIDSLYGVNGVEAGANGFVTSVNASESGKIRTCGFDMLGKGPDNPANNNELNLSGINWVPLNPGISNLEIIINDLVADDRNTVGLPSTINNSISVKNVILGDVNDNQLVNIIDSLLVAQYYVGMQVPGLWGFNLLIADVDSNDQINIIDALLIAQFYVGIIPTF